MDGVSGTPYVVGSLYFDRDASAQRQSRGRVATLVVTLSRLSSHVPVHPSRRSIWCSRALVDIPNPTAPPSPEPHRRPSCFVQPNHRSPAVEAATLKPDARLSVDDLSLHQARDPSKVGVLLHSHNVTQSSEYRNRKHEAR